MNSDHKTNALPQGMSIADITRTIRDQGFGDVEPKSAGQHFHSECCEWLSEWFDKYSDDQLKHQLPFAFLFDTDNPTDQILPQATIRHAFRNAFDINTGGHLYAAAIGLRKVYGQPVSTTSGPELFGKIAGNGWQGLSVVVVSPQSRNAVLHLAGADPDDATVVFFKSKGNNSFSFESLDIQLEQFYADCVETHLGYCDIWKVATKRTLKENAERQIQGSLCLFFQYGVLTRSERLDQEVHTRKGRADIRIIKAKADQSMDCAFIELKVLRPNTDALAWAKEGVDQVHNYSLKDPTVTSKYICCYDAQNDDQAMPDGVAYAKCFGVSWRRYFMTTPGCDRKIVGYDS